jgi:alkanesulfonate monooxygenase SsuD/methylene tetrahydromethanopterin reductase-like flavin-dependent oxidoreductase (luciferase family)
MGFDGLGVNEHHQNGYGLMPSPNIMAASLARRTRNANLVVLGNSIALYNPPIRVAEEFAMLDVLSGGRLVAGFPVGTSMDVNFCYGEVPATIREKYQEAHDLIIRAWKEREPFAFNGKYTKLRYVNLWPRPIQQPHPPVWIPGGGSIETWDFVADHDYQYSFLSFFGYIAGKRVSDGYWDVMAKKGKELNPYSLGFAQVVAVSETDEQAERDYGEHMDYFYNRCLHVHLGFADAPGYRTPSTIKAGLLGQFTRGGSFMRQGLKWKDFVNDGYIIAGSPATVRDRLRHALTTLRCGHLMILQQIGSMPPELTRKNTELFAREVMPHMRDLWSEYEDRWSPRRLPADEIAEPAPISAYPTNGKTAGKSRAKSSGKSRKPAATETRSSAK